MCGDCCRLVALDYSREDFVRFVPNLEATLAEGAGTPEELRRDGDNLATARFALEHWHEVSPARARRMFPVFAEGRARQTFYACDRFDERTNRCMAHDTKPPVCAGYPWYGEPPREGRISRAFTRCGYLALVPLARRDGAVVEG